MFKISLFLFIFFFQNIFFGCEKISNYYITIQPHTSTILYYDNGEAHIEKARFGNQLHMFLKALYIARKYNFIYLHTHFDFDYMMKGSNCFLGYEDFKDKNLKRNEIFIIQSYKELSKYIFIKHAPAPIVFVVDHASFIFPYLDWDLDKCTEIMFDIDFLNYFKQLLTPTVNLDIITPPKDLKSVAVHIRKGGGYDSPLFSLQYYDEDILKEQKSVSYDYVKLAPRYQDTYKPLKSLPEQFYVDVLNYIFQIYPDDDFYVHIFTDEQDTKSLLERIKNSVNAKNKILWGVRLEDNRHDKNEIADCLSLMNFDILFRTKSTYSVFAHVFGNHELVIWPESSKWIGKCLVGDKVCFQKRIFVENECDQKMTSTIKKATGVCCYDQEIYFSELHRKKINEFFLEKKE